MLQHVPESLRSIINSKNGLHLSCYIENMGSLESTKEQIKECIDVAHHHLEHAMDKEQRKSFVAPLEQLLRDKDILAKFNGNIGLFRTTTSFRMINIPIEVEHICVMATSFHVKPLLHWMQVDREFLLLGVNDHSAHIYLGTHNSLKKIDQLSLKSSSTSNKAVGSYEDVTEWTNEWIYRLTETRSLPFYFSGSHEALSHVAENLRYPMAMRVPVTTDFQPEKVSDVVRVTRALIHDETKELLANSLVEYYWAENFKLGRKNIFQIAKAAVKGKVKKLIISDGIRIFGQMDPRTGGISIHPFHLNHEDDDLLDDLAQTVLSKGGEVIVAKRGEIPKDRPVLAILNDETSAPAKLIELNIQEPTRRRYA